MCLTGDALTVIGRMTAADLLDYQKVKQALLWMLKFTAEGYQKKLRKHKKQMVKLGDCSQQESPAI